MTRAAFVAPCISPLLAFVLAAIAVADEPRIVGRTRQELLQELATAEGQQRDHAAWALAQLAAGQADASDPTVWIDDLYRLAQDDSPPVRYWGLVGLRQFLSRLPADHPLRETAVHVLTHKLVDRWPAVRVAAADALAQAGQPRQALGVLVEAMTSPQESVRIQAVAALERIGLEQFGPAARPARDTLEAAIRDSSEYVKRISARALRGLEP